MERRKQKVNKRQLPTGSKQVNDRKDTSFYVFNGRRGINLCSHVAE